MRISASFSVIASIGCIWCISCRSGTGPQATDAGHERKPKIIFDTDMGPDYDDVGAIAVLHALADSGECDVLATVASDAHPSIAPTIALFNRYFGRDSLPVGTAMRGAPDFTAENGWNDTLINTFAPDVRARSYPSAVEVYRRSLANQPANSVTIVTVGFLSNISALLDSQPDAYSELNGVDLVKAKVKQLVAMAGAFPEGSEFNVNKHAQASVNVISKWPRPILFSGFEIGAKIFTGSAVARQGGNNPVSKAYAYNLMTYTKEGETNRNSWDQTAVLCAVRSPEDYFYVNGPGKFTVSEDGSNTWDPTVDAGHYFISHKYPYAYIGKVIEALMLQASNRQ
ncbi:Inosine-uridine nucleoside N-ribohydrolase [Parapedobacter koreensis]|uniref:Inosine-uridine nucleoside N-ribohydrolase n=2 Tax=Parapedobacter koreensis TaxID=332977 RepID=A0A1H7TIQ6_9SPHI|nr:Inosine-uridine nucleoside N-ribohydrolase [Parapedobacter koreensis]